MVWGVRRALPLASGLVAWALDTVAESLLFAAATLLAKPVGSRGPGPVREATEVARTVDVAPTLLALAGIRTGRSLDGHALAEVVPGGSPQRPAGAQGAAGERLQTTTPPPAAGPGR